MSIISLCDFDKFLITEMAWAYCAVFTDYLYII
jgi:hypothetical protein